jgi:lipopolysaccharide export system protein LptC
MNQKQTLLLTVVLLVAGALTWWLKQETEPPASGPAPGPHRADFTVDNFTITTMDLSGAPARRLTAQEMRHYPDDDSTELDLPRLTLFNQQAPPWLIRSERGWVSPDGELVLLLGQVFIDRDGKAEVAPMHLVTRDLRVQRKLEYAETDQPVSATSGSSEVKAVGMQAWLGEPMRIKLLSKVRGRYEVN